MTLVPTRMYFKNGHVKVAIGLAKGKKAHDKRETVRSAARPIARPAPRSRNGAPLTGKPAVGRRRPAVID